MGRKCTVNNCTTKNSIANRLLCKLASMQSPMVFLNIDIAVWGSNLDGLSMPTLRTVYFVHCAIKLQEELQ